ncbi:hypothetical protein J6G99_08355 [bacterium]|nr:hypothetical protein [bacterium]
MNKVVNSNINFCALKPISKSANKATNGIIKDSQKELEDISRDLDLEIIYKRGFLTQIKSLIFFATKKGESVGDWFSLSIDKNGYMPQQNPRYLTVDKFTKENIIEAAKNAINNLNKYKWNLPKPTLPVDLILLAKILKH